jgi:tellurium resistance protein TerZ
LHDNDNDNRCCDITIGDNTTGEGDGDDEQIVVQMKKLPADVLALGVTVTSYRGQSFAAIKGAYCRLIDV